MNRSENAEQITFPDTSASVDERMNLIYRKVGWRILPLMIVSYMLAYMDRVNISFAKLDMQHDLGMNDAIYGFAAGIFFLGYVIFEVPSNLLLAKIGARKTLSRIMVLWGITAASMFVVRDKETLYILRFMLGVFEAGFGPGMLFYLTIWYGTRQRARVMSYVLLASPIAGIIGGPLSTWIMSALDKAGGMAGWQWLFLLEGTPCVLLGIFTWFWLDDTPEGASWLTSDERKLLLDEVARGSRATHRTFGEAVKDFRVYGLALTYFCMISGLYAIGFWLPTLLTVAGVSSSLMVGAYSALPYVAAVIAMVMVARHSDRTRERRWHAAVGCSVAAVALIVAASTLNNLAISLAALTIANAAIYAAYTVFWAMPGDYLTGTAAAGGMALINSVGLLGGFVSPMIIGNLKLVTGSLAAGLGAIVVILFVGALVLAVNRLPKGHLQK